MNKNSHVPDNAAIELGVERVVEAAITEGTLGPESPWIDYTVAQYRARLRDVPHPAAFRINNK